MTDAITMSWVRNAADQRATGRGMKLSVNRGSHAIWWIEHICRLYEGEHAGERLILRGCHKCHIDPPYFAVFDDEAIAYYADRAAKHNDCFIQKHDLDWQYECFFRLFAWEKWSSDFNRHVRRFNRGSIWVAKKNKKSPSLAAASLYVFCGDGEPGQKVYLGAKDGNQAREIAGMHIVTMYEKSGLLQEQCDLNKSLMQIRHNPSNSIIKPISSSDARSQKSKEGLNGSVFIDEGHVVDGEFIGRVDRAGISRSEPLVPLTFSTAGDDPMGWGFKEFEYGRDVNNGKTEDDGYFYAAYCAPQNLTDADLAADPVRYGKMANPAWGHTVRESEFLEDYMRSRPVPSEFARFKKYRLNIWQKSATPWLPPGAWEACLEDYNEADLLGMPCYGALDFARTRDTSSLTLLFPQDDGSVRVLNWHWLPEKRAYDLRGQVKYLEWAQQGWITLTPGDVCDYGYIRKQVNGIRQKFDLRKLAYDVKYAAETMQHLVEQDGMDRESQEEFGQSLMNFAGPTAAVFRWIVERKIRQNGNPVLQWQLENTDIYTDCNENSRPIKPKQGPYKTIDGTITTIMAAAMMEKYGNLVAPQILVF